MGLGHCKEDAMKYLIALCSLLSIITHADLPIREVQSDDDRIIYIASARKLGERIDGQYGVSSYHIETVYQGEIKDKIITVLFLASTYTRELPSHALLLLWRDGGRIYRAIGNDASRAILQYDERIRSLARTGDLNSILEETLEPSPLDESDAVRLIIAKMKLENIDEHQITDMVMSRYVYGWRATAVRKRAGDKYDAISLLHILVDDEGKIIQFREGNVRIRQNDPSEVRPREMPVY